ncbi:MAG: hypothetical protein ACTSXY_02560, partial [Promethearchaeota archaeon]
MTKSHRFGVVKKGGVQAGSESICITVNTPERAKKTVPYIHVKRHGTTGGANGDFQERINLFCVKKTFLL